MVKRERQKMLAGGLCDPRHPELATAGERGPEPGDPLDAPLHPFDAALRGRQGSGKPVKIGSGA